MKFGLLFIFLSCGVMVNPATIQHQSKIRYDNCSVFRVNIPDRKLLPVLDIIKSATNKFDVWKEYDEVSREVHVMIDGDSQPLFLALLKTYGLPIQLMIPNVQALIDQECPSDVKLDSTFGWTRYYELEEIETWLDDILNKYPDVTSAFTIGKSHENRDIRGIKISYKSDNPGIFIESNIHAREWITSATATWFINELLTSENTAVRDLATNYDWYIIPVFNVDGFVYSHRKDRLWRKTRQSVPNNACIGTDANRNFDSHWMENNGASSNPCSETFAGPTPFSEPEALALANYVTSIKDKINIYLSFHSYGQYLLSPYGHITTEVPENHDDLLSIGASFTDAIGKLPYRTEYTHGTTAQVLYVASGSSVDWVFNTLGTKVAYTIEYRDKGRYGFILPPVQILPNCEELMAGMLALIAKSKELGYV